MTKLQAYIAGINEDGTYRVTVSFVDKNTEMTLNMDEKDEGEAARKAIQRAQEMVEDEA